jgi:hypothetical protein
VLGVVVEVAMKEGLDLLACYADRSARYYNHGGDAIIWERPDASMDHLVSDLLSAGQRVADQIGPWQATRPGAPGRGRARLDMLTPAGLRFGEAPFDALARDVLAGPAIQAAAALMQELIHKTERS